MNFEIVGKVILKEETLVISDRFKKREFVIEVENERNSDWNDFIKFQLTQDRCEALDTINVNSEIKVSFNIKGRKWEKDGKVNYFSNLEAWRIELLQAVENTATANGPGAQDNGPLDNSESDLPF